MKVLTKYNLLEIVNKGLTSSLQGAKDKEQDKEQEEDKDKDKEKGATIIALPTIQERETKFHEKLVSDFGHLYTTELLSAFARHWTEYNAGGRLMKWEMQETFDVKKRLITWFNNDKKFNNNGKSNYNGTKATTAKIIHPGRTAGTI